jgi:hypothetical protein
MERKDAIEVIKKNWPDSSFTMLREALETLIPELKESEDEKIRKALIDGFKDYKGWDEEWFDGITVREAIAWLEKQKRFYSDYEESELRRGLLWHLNELRNIEKSKGLPIKAKATYDDWIAWLEKQRGMVNGSNHLNNDMMVDS